MNTTKEDSIGQAWEKGFFGVSSAGHRKPGGRKTAIRPTFEAATSEVFRCQSRKNWVTNTPHTTLGRELFDCVKSYLPAEQKDRLQLFCAIGTSLDYFYSIDGFFLLDEKRVNIDLRVSDQDGTNSYGTFPLIMRECTGPQMWRVGEKIARRLLRD